MRSARLPVHERLPIRENGERQLLTGGYLSSSGDQRLWQPLSLLALFALIRYRCTRCYGTPTVTKMQTYNIGT